MIIPTSLIRRYFTYRLKAVNAHSLHSPFLFEFYNQVIKGSNKPWSSEADRIRRFVLDNSDTLSYTDPRTNEIRKEPISTWARRVTSQKKFSLFLIKLINWLDAKTIIETGTAAGINSCCLALSNVDKVITLEGSNEIAAVADRTINKFGKEKVLLVQGKVQDTFSKTINEYQPDVIFLDADHRSETISQYLMEIDKLHKTPKAIIVHDIHWSEDMEIAWNEIVSNNSYSLTVDLFQAGIIFPERQMPKQHFIIKF